MFIITPPLLQLPIAQHKYGAAKEAGITAHTLVLHPVRPSSTEARLGKTDGGPTKGKVQGSGVRK